MPHIRPQTQVDAHALSRINWRAVAEFFGDLIGAVSIFTGGYALLLIGHGLGLN